MFFVLSKIIYWCIMPLSLITLCLVTSLLIKHRKAKKILFITGTALLLFFSNPFLATLAMNSWEPKPKLYQELDKTYTYGILLAGVTIPDRPPYDRIQFSKGADRVAHAIELYRLGKITKVLISGGSGTLTFKGKSECEMIKTFAINAGVKDKDIITDDQSRNTRENAIHSAKLIKESDTNLLITSAFHMYRASGCFEALGIKFDTFPTDYYGGVLRWSPGSAIVPNFFAIEIWSKLIKEWFGIMAYKVAGYI